MARYREKPTGDPDGTVRLHHIHRNRAPIVALFGLILAAVLLQPIVASARPPLNELPESADSPLRPPDTSSPRDTLLSFMTDVTISIEAWRNNAFDDDAYRARWRALQTLDFGTTRGVESFTHRTVAGLQLKEILDRITLPPLADIPGDEEIAGSWPARWVIPNTRITIARVASGPRAGEYLFTADTVANLDRYYQLVKDLPYRPGATAGIYDEYIDRGMSAFRAEGLSHLRPIDTSSPQSTLEGFLHNINRAYSLIIGTNQSLGTTLPGLTRDEAAELEARAEALMNSAVGTLDLSDIAETLRTERGIEVALMLKEVIDRLPPPLRVGVPDERAVRTARGLRAETESAEQGQESREPIRWVFPDTHIEIVEIQDGPRQGEFRFSADTVDRADDFYQSLRQLPYLTFRGDRLDLWNLDLILNSPSEGFYEFYASSGGYLVPNAHFLGRLISHMPDWLKLRIFEQALWQWIGLAICLIVAGLAGLVAATLQMRFAARLPPPYSQWANILLPLIIMLIAITAEAFTVRVLGMTGRSLEAVRTVSEAIVFTMAAWAVFRFMEAAMETVIHVRKTSQKGIDAALLRICTRLVAFMIAAWIVIDGVQGLGVHLVPLLAGLGVGGLAVALAAQSVIANFIGSLILFANRPVRVGDFCRYGDQIGTVEDIGMHSTRIRSLERTIVTVPNAEFSSMKLDNYSKRDSRLFQTVLQLRYETTPDQLRYLLARLRELLLGHPMVTPDPARVRFIAFSAYSKDLEVFAYLRCRDQDSYLAITEDLLLRIDEIVAEAGTGFAFPSQTAYLGRDPGLDPERTHEAEGHVAAWRTKGKLPFPEFEEEEQERLTDILDYPPEGSPNGR